jgi:TolA-binding protein
MQRSGAAELQFLLGYVYYQTGRLQDAQKTINSAYEKDPTSPAVGTMKKAIDDALISEPQKKQGQKP